MDRYCVCAASALIELLVGISTVAIHDALTGN
jgi:hypothetical protein